MGRRKRLSADEIGEALTVGAERHLQKVRAIELDARERALDRREDALVAGRFNTRTSALLSDPDYVQPTSCYDGRPGTPVLSPVGSVVAPRWWGGRDV